MRFDPHKVHIPLLDEVCDAEWRDMPYPQKFAHMDAINRYVRQAHAQDFLVRNPSAMPADILLDWLIITGVDKLVPPDLLAYHTTDKPIIVLARPSEPEKADTPHGTEHAAR